MFAPIASTVQAQGALGAVRARSCAVGTDTLSSLGVTAGGTITVSDGTTARAVPYTTADTVATVASNVQGALRSTAAIDAGGTSSYSSNGVGIGPFVNSSSANFLINGVSQPPIRVGWFMVPNAISFTDITGDLISKVWGATASPQVAANSVGFSWGPEFRLKGAPGDSTVLNGSEVIGGTQASPASSTLYGAITASTAGETLTVTNVSGISGRTLAAGKFLYKSGLPIGTKITALGTGTGGTGTYSITSSTSLASGLLYAYNNDTGYLDVTNGSGTFKMTTSGESVTIAYDATSLSVNSWRDLIKDVASHQTHLDTSTNGLTIADVTGTLATTLGLVARPTSSKPLGDGTFGDTYSNGTKAFYDLDFMTQWNGSESTLENVSVGNIPVATSGASGAFTITKSGISRAVSWTSADTISSLAGKIQTVLRSTAAISTSGTADFGTSNTSKVTIAATGKTLTLSDTNSGATGALAKLKLPTTATASPVVSTATIVTTGGTCVADTTPPTVSTITTTAAGTKKVGDTVTVTVTFSEAVTTTGTSSLLLETGTTDTAATCPAVTASTTLTCTYTVASGDTVTRLDVQSISALTGTIVDAVGNAYVTANGLPALGSSGLYGANLTVDGVVPVAPSTVSLAGPSDTGISPSDGITNQTSVAVTGTAEAGSTVALRDGGTPIGGATATTSGGGAFSITVTLAAGAHTLTATATDPAGNTSAASAPLAVTIDTTAPTVASIVRTGGAVQATTGATAPSFTVTFSEAVSGLGVANFAVASGATIGGTAPSIASVTGSGTTWTVTLGIAGTTGDGSGTASLGLIVVSRGGVTDAAGNLVSSDVVRGLQESYLLESVIANNPIDVRLRVRLASVRDTSFTASWVTDVAANGTIRWGPDDGTVPTNIAYDKRGATGTFMVHYATVSGLTPSTRYRFDVVSGATTDSNGGAHYLVTTGPTLNASAPDQVVGTVSLRDGGVPTSVVVHVTASGPSGTSAPLAALVTSAEQRYWGVNLGNLRTASLDAAFPMTADTTLTVTADGGPDGTAAATTTVAVARAGTLALVLSDEVSQPLQAGWNLVALRATPASATTASMVCIALNAGTAGTAVELDRWVDGGWEGHRCGLPVNDFAVETGVGYFVRLTRPATWTYRGAVVATPATLSLGAGWNLVGASAIAGTPSVASVTCTQVNATQAGTAVELDRWVDGGWEGHRCGLPVNDFTLQAGQGYFIRLTRPATWAPVGAAPVLASSVRR